MKSTRAKHIALFIGVVSAPTTLVILDDRLLDDVQEHFHLLLKLVNTTSVIN
jgi:hypothetical protein